MTHKKQYDNIYNTSIHNESPFAQAYLNKLLKLLNELTNLEDNEKPKKLSYDSKHSTVNDRYCSGEDLDYEPFGGRVNKELFEHLLSSPDTYFCGGNLQPDKSKKYSSNNKQLCVFPFVIRNLHFKGQNGYQIETAFVRLSMKDVTNAAMVNVISCHINKDDLPNRQETINRNTQSIATKKRNE
jgi:hypothetical protein